ncbi:MAG: peptidase, partial [Lachnospiraceae bacterium]|nr:peptidase [Lachnospiraceae bacterium]
CKDDSMFYYREKKLSFTKLEDVEKRAEQAIRKKIPFLFHWRGGYLTREMLQELLMSLQKAAGKKERYIKVNINWPQAVLWVEFEEKEPAEEVVMEEANEGESSNFIKE